VLAPLPMLHVLLWLLVGLVVARAGRKCAVSRSRSFRDTTGRCKNETVKVEVAGMRGEGKAGRGPWV
jgi:hypothetical protein